VKIAFQLVVDAAEHTTSGTVIDMAHIGSEITFPTAPHDEYFFHGTGFYSRGINRYKN